MSKSVKCVRDFRDLPPSAYALPTDGRKAKKLRVDRRALTNLLASFANGDGASITVGIKRIMSALEWSRATVFRRLEELRQLGILKNDGKLAFQGTQLRRLDASAIRSKVSDRGPKVSDSGDPTVSDSRAKVSDRGPKVSNRRSMVSRIGETQPSIQTVQQTDHPTAPVKAGGADGEHDFDDEDDVPPRPLPKSMAAMFRILARGATIRPGLGERHIQAALDRLEHEYGRDPVLAAWHWFVRNRDFTGLTKTSAARLFITPTEFDVALDASRRDPACRHLWEREAEEVTLAAVNPFDD